MTHRCKLMHKNRRYLGTQEVALNYFCVYEFHVVFHCLQGGGVWGVISVCCVICIVKYGLFHVSWLMWF